MYKPNVLFKIVSLISVTFRKPKNIDNRLFRYDFLTHTYDHFTDLTYTVVPKSNVPIQNLSPFETHLSNLYLKLCGLATWESANIFVPKTWKDNALFRDLFDFFWNRRVLLIITKNDRDQKSFANNPLLVPFSCTYQAVSEWAEIIIIWYLLESYANSPLFLKNRHQHLVNSQPGDVLYNLYVPKLNKNRK